MFCENWIKSKERGLELVSLGKHNFTCGSHPSQLVFRYHSIYPRIKRKYGCVTAEYYIPLSTLPTLFYQCDIYVNWLLNARI